MQVGTNSGSKAPVLDSAATVSTTGVASPSTTRIPSLDGVRGLAILLVCIGHAGLSETAPDFLTPVKNLGNIGVRIFFVLSGFLITTLLLQEFSRTGQISLRKFYIRRALRIFPALYVVIGVVALLETVGFLSTKPGEILYAATFTMNYFDYAMIWLGQTWSLAVEEQFYILWPLLLVLLARRGAVACAVGAVILSPLIRTLMWYVHGSDETAMTKHFESVMDTLAVGCLLALYRERIAHWFSRLDPSYGSWMLLSLSALLFGAGYGSYLVKTDYYYVWGQSVANLGVALGLAVAVHFVRNPAVMLLSFKPLVWLGAISYSLYLWQNLFLLGEGWGLVGEFPINLAVSVGIAWLSYRVIELPCLKLKHRFG